MKTATEPVAAKMPDGTFQAWRRGLEKAGAIPLYEHKDECRSYWSRSVERGDQFWREIGIATTTLQALEHYAGWNRVSCHDALRQMWIPETKASIDGVNIPDPGNAAYRIKTGKPVLEPAEEALSRVAAVMGEAAE